MQRMNGFLLVATGLAALQTVSVVMPVLDGGADLSKIPEATWIYAAWHHWLNLSAGYPSTFSKPTLTFPEPRRAVRCLSRWMTPHS